MFPAHKAQFGVKRSGEWEEVSIPIAEFVRGKISLNAMRSAFSFANEGKVTRAPFNILINDVIWMGAATADAEAN